MTRTRSFGGTQQILAIAKRRHSPAVPAMIKRLRRVAPPGGNLDVAERLARGLIARHGNAAARTAATHLNRVIDRGDAAARDFWAGVVHLIHQRQDEAVAPGAVPRVRAQYGRSPLI
jgi:hypothetical protein